MAATTNRGACATRTTPGVTTMGARDSSEMLLLLLLLLFTLLMIIDR
jgi:hypothetical protein